MIKPTITKIEVIGHFICDCDGANPLDLKPGEVCKARRIIKKSFEDLAAEYGNQCPHCDYDGQLELVDKEFKVWILGEHWNNPEGTVTDYTKTFNEKEFIKFLTKPGFYDLYPTPSPGPQQSEKETAFWFGVRVQD